MYIYFRHFCINLPELNEIPCRRALKRSCVCMPLPTPATTHPCSQWPYNSALTCVTPDGSLGALRLVHCGKNERDGGIRGQNIVKENRKLLGLKVVFFLTESVKGSGNQKGELCFTLVMLCLAVWNKCPLNAQNTPGSPLDTGGFPFVSFMREARGLAGTGLFPAPPCQPACTCFCCFPAPTHTPRPRDMPAIFRALFFQRKWFFPLCDGWFCVSLASMWCPVGCRGKTFEKE